MPRICSTPWEVCRDGRTRARHAGQLDRQECRRAPGFPYDIEGFGATARCAACILPRARYAHGGDILRGGGGASAAAFAARGNAALTAFIEECKRGPAIEGELATQEKKGIPTGLTVRHPISGEAVPVWVGNYVLMSYGDGAVMACRAR